MKKWIRTPQGFAFCMVLVFFFIAILDGQNGYALLADGISRIGMNGVLVLAMLPAIACGTGPNFGLSIGICFGLAGGVTAIEFSLSGMSAFFVAAVLGMGLSIPAGFLYGKALNRTKGNEMTASTYLGFSVVAFFSILWLWLPFSSPEMVWAIGGKGLRTTLSLEGRFAGVIDQLVSVKLCGYPFSFGGVLMFAGLLLFCFLFFESRIGTKLQLAGENPLYAQIHGIKVNHMRVLGTILSTMLGALGILLYAQSYGFMQLYQAPLYMPFLAVSAALLGGATLKHCTVKNIVLGTVLLQFLFVLSAPVVNAILKKAAIADAVRILLTYGILLYALLQQEARGKTG